MSENSDFQPYCPVMKYTLLKAVGGLYHLYHELIIIFLN
jgi:hypothetical protein